MEKREYLGRSGDEENVYGTAEDQAIARLRILARLFINKGLIIGGVDEEARLNNKKIVAAIKEIMEGTETKENEVFGVLMAGSRSMGYNVKDSDVDIVSVIPKDASSKFAWNQIKAGLVSRGLQTALDERMAFWAGYEVPVDPEEFVYMVDHDGTKLISLFGHTIYENSNLRLGRLAALEIIKQYRDSYRWLMDAEYSESYLGNADRIVSKVAERFGVAEREVRKIFTPELFAQRSEKFSMRSQSKIMYLRLIKWFDSNKENLSKFVMFDLYQEVLKMIGR